MTALEAEKLLHARALELAEAIHPDSEPSADALRLMAVALVIRVHNRLQPPRPLDPDKASPAPATPKEGT